MSQGLSYAKRICYSSEATLNLTYDLAREYAALPGCYVECGVAAGAQIIAMSIAAPDKQIYAFDSFDGIPLPSNRDDQMPGLKMLTEYERKNLPDPGKQILQSSGATVVTEENFWINIESALGSRGNITTVKGWFEETVENFKEPIALLRLDGDLYNSTFVCLLHMFPNLLDGGVLIIDDINLKGCADACREYFDFIGYEPGYIFEAGVCFLIK